MSESFIRRDMLRDGTKVGVETVILATVERVINGESFKLVVHKNPTDGDYSLSCPVSGMRAAHIQRYTIPGRVSRVKLEEAGQRRLDKLIESNGPARVASQLRQSRDGLL